MANLLDSSARFCVPIFLMLTGALLIPKIYQPLVFYRKRAQRILWPFLFWATVYLTNHLFFKLQSTPEIGKIPKIISEQLKNGISYHFWYIFLILLIYIFLPFVAQKLQTLRYKYLKIGLIIWATITQLCLNHLIKASSPINPGNFLLLSGYVVLGYFYAHRVTIKYPKLSIWLILLSLSSIVFLTYWYTVKFNHFYPLFYAYLSLPVMILAVGIFVATKHYAKPSKSGGKIINLVSKYSFGIYLSHVFVLFWLGKHGLNWQFINPFVGIPTTIICTLALSGLLVYALRKLPLGKFIAG